MADMLPFAAIELGSDGDHDLLLARGTTITVSARTLCQMYLMDLPVLRKACGHVSFLVTIVGLDLVESRSRSRGSPR